MAAPTKQAASSRWGSFLQQAVAGVESRLDNILAEGDEAGSAASANSKTNAAAAGGKTGGGALTPGGVGKSDSGMFC